MTYLDKIRSLNDLQLCYFLNLIQADLHLVGLAMEWADNPKIYCSANGFTVGAPKLVGMKHITGTEIFQKK